MNFAGISFPVQVKDINKFERLNAEKYGISINLYAFDENDSTIKTLRISKQIGRIHIHLLLLTSESNSHYCWIKDLSKVLSSQLTTDHRKKYFCGICLNYFYDEQKLLLHKPSCLKQNECQIEMPAIAEAHIKFKKYSNKLLELL